MGRRNRLAALLLAMLTLSPPALAIGQVYIYPARGQSPQQEEFDKGQCYTWAVQQSGFDPANPTVASGPPPMPGAPQGGMFRGRPAAPRWERSAAPSGAMLARARRSELPWVGSSA